MSEAGMNAAGMSPQVSARIEALKRSAAAKPHGTRARYIAGRCRCELCRAANSRYQCGRDRAKARGNANPIVSATEAREHILELGRQGMGYLAVADAARINHGVCWGIRSGERKRALYQSVQRILAVDLSAGSDGMLIRGGATWKLLDELIEDGYSKTQLATWLGYGGKHPAIQLRRDQVTAKSAARVERLYNLIRAGKLERGGPSPLSPVKPRGRGGKRPRGPRDPNAPRCECGKFTLKCAKARAHHCAVAQKAPA